MSAAGIGTGAVRDELECHLRDSFDALVRSGLDPATAFAEAAAKLGAPTALRREYATALTRWTRLKRFLGRRVELFPADMRICAWAAIPAAVMGVIGVIQYLETNWIFFARETLASGHYSGAISGGLFSALVLLISLTGLVGAHGYLRHGTYISARNLARFWVFTGWLGLVVLLMVVRALGNGSLANDGRLVLSTLRPWPLSLTLGVALLAYHDWKKRLCAAAPKSGV